MTIKDQIESEPLNIRGRSYARQRGYTDALLAWHYLDSDPIKACREYLAASRRAMLHSLEAVHCPDEIIKAIFAPESE